MQWGLGVNMDNERLLGLSEEFGEFLLSLQTLYHDALAGFAILYQRLVEYQTGLKACLSDPEVGSVEFQDKCLIGYKELCGEDFSVASESGSMLQGDVKKRTQRNGRNEIEMGRACVVIAYAYWDAYLHKEFDKALGFVGKSARKKLNDRIHNYFWEDMCRLRNAILHEKGRATKEFAEMRILTWFSQGESLDLDFEKMKVIFDHLVDFRNWLGIISIPRYSPRFPSGYQSPKGIEGRSSG